MDDERSGPDEAPGGPNEGAPEPDEEGLGGPAEDLEEDPAYNPDDEGLKQIKGG
jgi:hypothetical protein